MTLDELADEPGGKQPPYLEKMPEHLKMEWGE